MKRISTLAYVLCTWVMYFPVINGNKRIFFSEFFVEFIYSTFEVNAFDHCQILFDTEEQNNQEYGKNFVEKYMEVCMSKFEINSNLTIPSLLAVDRKIKQRYAALYYLSISTTSPTKISEFLQKVTSINLANDIWLIALDVHGGVEKKSEMEISNFIQDLLPGLQLDSKVLVIIPNERNWDSITVYEIYRVSAV